MTGGAQPRGADAGASGAGADDGAARSRSEQKLERLLAAAAALMARQGYDQTSIRDVSRETGLSLAGMYYYFASKEELLFLIQRRTFASLLEVQERAVAQGATPEEKLERLIRGHLAFSTQHAAELKVCTFELESIKDRQYQEIEALRRMYFRLAARVVRELLAAGRRSAASTRLVRHHTLFIFGMLNWLFMWFDPRRDGPPDRLAGEMIGLVLRGLPREPARRDGPGAAAGKAGDAGD